MEIERKFLVKEIPSLAGMRAIEMEQYYLSTDPVIRIRRADDRRIFTYKSGHGLVRREEEFDIPKEDYDKLLQKKIGHGVYKTRYIIPLPEDLRAELDVYKGRLSDLTVVEVEFHSEEDAKRFIPPEWFGQEVTEDLRYTNSMLAFRE